jgi:FkbM family methyltransferase
MILERRARVFRSVVRDSLASFSAFFRGDYNFDLLAGIPLSVLGGFWRRIGIYPRKISLPDGLEIYIYDITDFGMNFADQYLRKEYELHEDYIPKKGWTVLDIGAYTGLFSLRASKLIGDEGVALAFEPNPNAYYWLVLNIRLNRIENVKTSRLALGDRIGLQELCIVTSGNIAATSAVRDHILKNLGTEVKDYTARPVPLVTLDNVTSNTDKFVGKTLRYYDLVKLDVEGFELRVLKGSRRALENGLIERLIVEIHLDCIDSDSVIEFLEEFGYIADKMVRFGDVKEMAYFSLKK